MPEECTAETDLEKVLDRLEDYNLNGRNYQALQNALDSTENITAPLADKLLSLCVQDKIEDLKYTTYAIKIISSILKKIVGGCSELPNLVPSAMAILNVLKTTALFNKVETLKTLCFEIIGSYPDESLITLTVNHSNEIFELINLYCHQLIPVETRTQTIKLVAKLLRILPPDKKATFVKDGIKVWFSKVIPVVVGHTAASNTVPGVLEALELLTDELVPFDYSNNHDWLIVLENIYIPKRYPTLMKTLLENGSDHWYRLWIVFIKLLKGQITKCTNTTASPINSLLPCVELAFKMDIKNRCRAFLCWMVLIDNFSKETNEVFLNKRLKLLVVPLTSNNAKVEEVALTKFDTWWHLITRFQAKTEKFLEMILVPFLHFCFGKQTGNTLIPGKISERTKVQSVRAFINITGHTQCEGCVSLPKLNVKLLNTKFLVNQSKDWIHSLSNAIKICAEHHDEFSEEQIKCVWKSFIITIGELPDNNVKRGLFDEILQLLATLAQDFNKKLLDVIVNILIPALFDINDTIQDLLRSKDEPNTPVQKIVSILNKLPLDNLEDRKNTIKSMEVITNFMMADAVKTSSCEIEWFMTTLSSNNLLLWTAMVESICFYKDSLCPSVILKMFFWPLKFMNNFINYEESTTAWLNMYKIKSPYFQMKSINKDIVEILQNHAGNQSSCVFVLSVSIAILEEKLCQNDTDIDTEIELILQLTSNINKNQIILLLPSLAGVLVNILTSLNKNPNITIAEHILLIINNILKISHSLFMQPDHKIFKDVESIFKSLESTLQLEIYSKLKSLLIDQLKKSAPYLKHKKTLSNHILAIYKTALHKHLTEHIAHEITIAFEVDNESDSKQAIDQIANTNKFTTPAIKAAKTTKKEASIVNTVVENGEEYVVIKSNWKFNPRKLTNNQKEKLQRKREDIPALYQDLSQSQDEFKLTTWKTDSQDTSTASSKSANVPGNDDVSAILKNIPNSEFVPKIVENVITRSELNLNSVPHEETSLNDNKSQSSDKIKNVQTSIKDTRSPRMALKDRVFRNVRNLIEKSNIDHACKDMGSCNNENVLESPLPTKIKPSANQTNSAPLKINLERPSRVKRKPKKFADLELISLKKRRYSLTTNESQYDEIIAIPSEIIAVSSEKEKDDIENKDKSQEFVDISIEKSSLDKDTTSDVIHSLKHQENDKILVTTNNICFDAVENIKPTKSDVIQSEKCLINKNAKEISCLDDTNNLVLSTSITNKTDSNISNIYSFRDTENSDTSTPNVNKINEIEDKKENCKVDSLTKKTLSTPDKNDEKIENEIVDTETNVVLGPNKTNMEHNEKEKTFPLVVQNYVAPISSVQKIEETTEEKSCHNSDKNNSGGEINAKNENICSDNPINNSMSTPKMSKKISTQKFTQRKSKKSRIENQLAIDMVEGHPFLKVHSEKRLRRKTIVNSPNKRKSFSASRNVFKNKGTLKVDNKARDKEKSVSVRDSQNTQDISASQDFIESSQDSAVTTVSVKTSKPPLKKMPFVLLKDISNMNESNTLNLSEDLQLNGVSINRDNNSDIELPCNKTNVTDLTEEMDTEPIDDNIDVVIILSDDDNPPITISSAEVTTKQDTQITADADTQPIHPDKFSETNIKDKSLSADQNIQITVTLETSRKNDEGTETIVDHNVTNATLTATADDITNTMSESLLVGVNKEDTSSPCNNEQRKQDFLNNTLKISPIKILSPVRDQKSPSPETSTDYVVIKLTSPVQSNGEPFEKHQSPEIFTEDKVSPDKRDRSPPREEVTVTNTSPSSTLSLKKNRPQVRSGGRAAQMLGLCVPDRLQTVMASEKSTDPEEAKKSPSLNTSARRNLRILYNSSAGENESSEETEDSENFLKFKRTLPTIDCSPSGPILKRKLVDITDETTASPASKRKRVSFHDPPVSTTICVKKYLEPISTSTIPRSPQNSTTKRLERQMRAQTYTKSPRRLDNVLKLDSVLTKAVESFSEADTQSNEDAEISSLDETPVVEIVKTTDLNDTNPICIELVDCRDQIANIAAELSSPAMKVLLVKSLEGKLETIGDLAKMTELEVNRLSIKTPKVQVVKKVLNDYLSKLKEASEEITPTIEAAMSESIMLEANRSVEVQTDSTLVKNIDMQTESVPLSLGSSQTDSVLTLHNGVQTEESGSKSTADIVATCLSERPDFVQTLCEEMESKQGIVEKLSFDTITQILINRLNISNFKNVLTEVLDQHTKLETNDQDKTSVLSVLQDHLVKRYESKDLILFCSNLLRKVYDKTV